MNEAGTGVLIVVVAADVADRNGQHGQRAGGEAGQESCGEDDADANEAELVQLLEDLVVGELAEAIELGLEGFPHGVFDSGGWRSVVPMIGAIGGSELVN